MAEHVLITAHSPLVETVRLALREQADSICLQLQLACSEQLPEAVEAVHDARVAVRRSLTILQEVRPWIDRKWVDARSQNWRYFLRQLGHVRDMDIMVASAEQYCRDVPDAGSTALLALLQDKQKKRHRLLCRLLNSKAAMQKLGNELAAVSVGDAAIRMLPVPVSNKGEVRLFRLIDCLPVMVWRASAGLTVYHSIFPRPDVLADDEVVSAAILHRLRLAAKDFRYVLTFARPLLGAPADRLISEFKQFQDALGSWHDKRTIRRYLLKLKAGKQVAAAIEQWQKVLQEQEKERLAILLDRWSEMTPDWFFNHLNTCLTQLYVQQERGCGSSCCDCGNQN